MSMKPGDTIMPSASMRARAGRSLSSPGRVIATIRSPRIPRSPGYHALPRAVHDATTFDDDVVFARWRRRGRARSGRWRGSTVAGAHAARASRNRGIRRMGGQVVVARRPATNTGRDLTLVNGVRRIRASSMLRRSSARIRSRWSMSTPSSFSVKDAGSTPRLPRRSRGVQTIQQTQARFRDHAPDPPPVFRSSALG